MNLSHYTPPVPDVPGPYPAFVEYFQPPHEALIQAFDWVHADFREVTRFHQHPVCEHVSHVARLVPFRLVHMRATSQDGDVIAYMERAGLRPALYEELLAFARAYPDAANEYDVIALGSWTHLRSKRNAFIGDRRSPGDDRPPARSLVLGWVLDGLDHDYSADCRFLAVAMSDDP